jgi:hypothetical protein
MKASTRKLVLELQDLLRVPDEREMVEDMLRASRHARDWYIEMAAQPFSVRSRGCGPPASAEAVFGDAAMQARIAEEERCIAELEAELAEMDRGD